MLSVPWDPASPHAAISLGSASAPRGLAISSLLNSIGISPSSAGSAACRFLLPLVSVRFFSPAEEISAVTAPLQEQIHPVSSAGAVLEGCLGGILGEGQR